MSPVLALSHTGLEPIGFQGYSQGSATDTSHPPFPATTGDDMTRAGMAPLDKHSPQPNSKSSKGECKGVVVEMSRSCQGHDKVTPCDPVTSHGVVLQGGDCPIHWPKGVSLLPGLRDYDSECGQCLTSHSTCVCIYC